MAHQLVRNPPDDGSQTATPMRVPFVDLQAQLEGIEADLVRAATEVIRSTRYIGGPKVEAFEEAIAGYTGARHAVGVSSGTDALLASLMALEVGFGDVVVTTPYSFFATAGVVSGPLRRSWTSTSSPTEIPIRCRLRRVPGSTPLRAVRTRPTRRATARGTTAAPPASHPGRATGSSSAGAARLVRPTGRTRGRAEHKHREVPRTNVCTILGWAGDAGVVVQMWH